MTSRPEHRPWCLPVENPLAAYGAAYVFCPHCGRLMRPDGTRTVRSPKRRRSRADVASYRCACRPKPPLPLLTRGRGPTPP